MPLPETLLEPVKLCIDDLASEDITLLWMTLPVPVKADSPLQMSDPPGPVSQVVEVQADALSLPETLPVPVKADSPLQMSDPPDPISQVVEVLADALSLLEMLPVPAKADSPMQMSDPSLDPISQVVEVLANALSLPETPVAGRGGFPTADVRPPHSTLQVVEVLADALSLPETPVPVKVARLLLVSDVLHTHRARAQRLALPAPSWRAPSPTSSRASRSAASRHICPAVSCIHQAQGCMSYLLNSSPAATPRL